jgi:beta-hydroxylase
MFMDAARYPFTADLAAGFRAVRQELDALAGGALRPWHDRHLYDGDAWKAFGLYAFGRKLEANCRLCPETTRLVEGVPGMLSAGFSRLEPGAHIRPHTGLRRGVYRCHLGLRVPSGCALRVEAETRSWREGECLVFDDTREHEAWNRGTTERVVLLVDFARAPGGFNFYHAAANWIDGLRFALFNRFVS